MSEWWKEQVVYQIYPRSFKDGNGDGIGDIPGIISKLDYLDSLGVGVIWLSPVYKSPNRDNGYDISDYMDINPEYGTMEDMTQLIKEASEHGIRIIMDLVINHTSDRHEWFQKSRAGEVPYKDYYIWKPGKKNGGPPNNWTGFFAENCWEFDPERGEYYMHLFAKEQPDLNFRNPGVLEEVKTIMEFWLEKGVAGFRCDVINLIWKTSYKDGKKRLALTGREHYISQEGVHGILRTLRSGVLDKYDCFTVGETVFVTPAEARKLCGSDRGELDMVFSFEHMEADQFFIKWFPRKFNLRRFASAIVKWQKALEWNANYLENHDQPRSVSRFGNVEKYRESSAKMLAVLLFTLKGTPFIYQGQELGMTNYDFTDMGQIKDIEAKNLWEKAKGLHIPEWYRWKMIRRGCRDHARTPMQWDKTENAGFTSGSPWLAVNENYSDINAKSQLGKKNSVWSFYRDMLELRRKSKILKYGDFSPIAAKRGVFAYRRSIDKGSCTVILNFTKKVRKFKMKGSVILSNYGRNRYKGFLEPYEAVILKNTRDNGGK